MKLLSRQEEIVLLAVWRLKEDASGVTIRQFITETTGKTWSIGSIYVPLDRLLSKGYLQGFYKDEANTRGGRKKRYYQLTTDGQRALEELLSLQKVLWEGFSQK